MCWMRSLLLVTQKNPLCAPSTRVSLFKFESTHIEASLVFVGGLVGRFGHRNRLATVVASEWFALVWAMCRKSSLFVCWLSPFMSAKRMRHAKPESPPWVSACTCHSTVRRHPCLHSDSHHRHLSISNPPPWQSPTWGCPSHLFSSRRLTLFRTRYPCMPRTGASQSCRPHSHHQASWVVAPPWYT